MFQFFLGSNLDLSRALQSTLVKDLSGQLNLSPFPVVSQNILEHLNRNLNRTENRLLKGHPHADLKCGLKYVALST